MKKTNAKRTLTNTEMTQLADSELETVAGGNYLTNLKFNFNFNVFDDIFVNGIPVDIFKQYGQLP